MSLPALLRNLDLNDPSSVLQAANATLKQSKTDLDAQHLRVVALLKLDRFDDAVRAFDTGGDALKQRAALEWAYALYKVGKLREAEDAAQQVKDRGMQHVYAQAAYRLEHFEGAAEAYKTLKAGSAEMVDGEENDLRINAAAVDAQLEWKGLGYMVETKKPERRDLEAFETAYNAACAGIARGELGQAEVLLRRAKGLCEALEDLSEEEKKVEIVPILVQLVYVLVRQGKIEEAEKIKGALDIDGISDPVTKHIAQVNDLAASKDAKNPYLVHRIFHDSSSPSTTSKTFEFQQSILRQNAYAIDLLSLKYDGVARSTASYIKSQPNSSTSPSVTTLSVLNAAAKAESHVGKAGLKAMLPLLKQRPDDVGLVLTIIHLYLLANNPGSAISVLESFLSRLSQATSPAALSARHSPGLIGTLVSLYKLQGRKSQLPTTALAEAGAYWQQKYQEDPSTLLPVGLLHAAGAALLASPKAADIDSATAIFKILHKHDPANRAAAAGLIAAVSATGKTETLPSSADPSSLPPLSDLLSSVDVRALEAGGVATFSSTSTSTAAATGTKRKADRPKEGKKRKLHKSRVPKDFDPDKKMDPERWLPLRDRSYWKPKGRKGKKRDGGATQGGVATGDGGERKDGGGQTASGGAAKKKGKKRK